MIETETIHEIFMSKLGDRLIGKYSDCGPALQGHDRVAGLAVKRARKANRTKRTKRSRRRNMRSWRS